jgi:ankyrin repeat protein
MERRDAYDTPERPQAAPLYYAVLCGFRGLIEHLIATFPRDVDARGGYYESPLVVALKKEDIDTALSLLQRGADVNARDKHGMSPLHRASQGGHTDIVQILLEHNADVNLPDLDLLKVVQT